MPGFEAQVKAIQNAVTAEQWERARRLAETLRQAYPNHATSWLWMAWLSEEPQQALMYAQQAAALDPTTGAPALAWTRERLAASAPPPTSAPLYATKRKGSAWGVKSWLQGMMLVATTGVVAMATMLWQGAAPMAAKPAVGRYVNIPANLDRPYDTLHRVEPPVSANRAMETVMEPTATFAPSPTALLAAPIFAPTPTLLSEAEMLASGREAIPMAEIAPPAVIPTATPYPMDTRNLLFPVWPNRFEAVVYRVQQGDNLTTIAARCGLSPLTLIWSNDSKEGNPELLTIGEQLWIPPLDGVLHFVKPGDTLEGIAAQYKVNVDIIRWFEGNDLEGTGGQLVAGQQIMVPGGVKPVTELPPAPAAPTTRGGASYFGWPTTGRMTQNYGAAHGGIDIANANKTPIFASQSGEIIYAGWDTTGYGYMILIDHHNGWRTRYAHLSGMYPAVGDWVNRGDLIALMGSTGNSTGPHLHFEIISRGYRFNPMTYLPR